MSDSSKGTNNKRRRVDEEDEGAETEEADTAPRQFVKLPEGMRAAMGRLHRVIVRGGGSR